MIIVIYGQPCSGKTTLSKKLNGWLKSQSRRINLHFMDGDSFRKIFANKDYSREGRNRNLQLASVVAHYEHSLNEVVLMSFVYPYKEAREYLNELTGHDVMWVYTYYDTMLHQRGRESFHVADFEHPAENEADLILNTGSMSEQECLEEIVKTFQKKYPNF
jgi:adenylylsulfate kinase-like enzyme